MSSYRDTLKRYLGEGVVKSVAKGAATGAGVTAGIVGTSLAATALKRRILKSKDRLGRTDDSEKRFLHSTDPKRKGALKTKTKLKRIAKALGGGAALGGGLALAMAPIAGKKKK